MGFVSNWETGKSEEFLVFFTDIVVILCYFLVQIRFVVSDANAHIVNTWSTSTQNLAHVSISR